MARRVTPAAASWLSRLVAVSALLVSIAASSGALAPRVILPMVGLVAIALVVSRWMPRLHVFAVGLTVFSLLRTPTEWAPLVIALLLVVVGLQLVSDRGRDVTLDKLRPTWIAAAATGLIATLLAGQTLGPFNRPPGSSSLPERQADGAAPPDGSNFLAELLIRGVAAVARWVGFGFGSGGGGDAGAQAGSAPPEAERDINWMRILIAAAVVLVVLVLMWWVWSRLRRRSVVESHDSDWAVRSLDETGRRVARARRLSEDPASYGGEIESSTSAGRLARAGLLVSERLYRPFGQGQTVSEEAVLRSELDGLADLPSAPKPPRRRPSMKMVGVVLAAVLFVGGGAFVLWRGLTSADVSPTHSMLTAPATEADGYRWVLCTLEVDVEPPEYSIESRGFVDQTVALSATEMFVANGGRIVVADGSEPAVIGVVGGSRSGWSEMSIVDQPVSHDMRHLRSIEGVIEAFGIEVEDDGVVEASVVTHHAWEVPNHTSSDPMVTGFGAAGEVPNRALRSSAHRVEAWATDTGVVERVRVTFQEFERTSIELRFVESVPMLERPGVNGASSLNLFGDCPRSQDDATATGWLGFEQYDALVSTVADVAVDGEGRAYDLDRIYFTEPIASTELGTIVFDGGSVAIFDGYGLLYGDSSVLSVSLDSDVPLLMTVSRLDVTSEYPFGVGLRFDREDHQVDQWELVSAECQFYSPVAVSTSNAGVWPGLSEEALYTDWLDPSLETVGDDVWIGYSGESEACFDVYVGRGNGEVQSILLRDNGTPWRLVAADGAPPAEIEAAERRLQECVDGDRPVSQWGLCRD